MRALGCSGGCRRSPRSSACCARAFITPGHGAGTRRKRGAVRRGSTRAARRHSRSTLPPTRVSAP
jgi:hypothetical protein